MCKVDHPTNWVNQMSVTKKKSGDIRICFDLRPLNLALKREHFMLPVFDDVVPKLSGARVFSVCDLKQGYHHVRLDEKVKSSHNICYTFRAIPIAETSFWTQGQL